MNANVRTVDIQIDGEKIFSTSEVGNWIVDFINSITVF